MTECERIIKEGILPESFFNEEIICNFKVTKERKKLFAVLLGILLKIDYVCKKHGIKYFIYGGTLIGALRHGGFIPWDDDLDIAMLRDDYDKFMKTSLNIRIFCKHHIQTKAFFGRTLQFEIVIRLLLLRILRINL